ncbi:gamma-glutamyltransferase, partial [Pseudomonas putida]|uniref:gamma-glutamyltransferase n=1 Tax=Pseudomonas putida TaxID=303 RepID=UPI003C7E0E1E
MRHLQGLARLRHAAALVGGVTVLQTLGMLEAVQRATPQRDLAALRPLASASPAGLEAPPLAVHLIAEAERLAYADRAQYLADSDYVPVPVKALTDPAYLARRAAQIGEHSMKRARPGQPQRRRPGPGTRSLAFARFH